MGQKKTSDHKHKRAKDTKNNPAIAIAIIGGIITVVTALITAIIGPITVEKLRQTPPPPETHTPIFTETLSPVSMPPPTMTSTSTPDMAFVSEGVFTMGDESDLSLEDAQPERKIFLFSYWIDIHEVTNEQYQTFILETNHRAPVHWTASEHSGEQGHHPVINVSWYDADAYCRFLEKRLPTEAEWEKASRGTGSRIWPWGNNWDPGKANTAENNTGRTRPVGSYQDGYSPYGVADMAGNVWEWVNDWYEGDYYKLGLDGGTDGPPIGQTKVLRGGAWTDASTLTYTFYRLGVFPPDYFSEVIGFRCACDNCLNEQE